MKLRSILTRRENQMTLIKHYTVHLIPAIEPTQVLTKPTSNSRLDRDKKERTPKILVLRLVLIPDAEFEPELLTSPDHILSKGYQGENHHSSPGTGQSGGKHKSQTLAFPRGQNSDDLTDPAEDDFDRVSLC